MNTAVIPDGAGGWEKNPYMCPGPGNGASQKRI